MYVVDAVFGMSYMLKSIGAIIEPWGKPFLMVYVFELTVFANVQFEASVRNVFTYEPDRNGSVELVNGVCHCVRQTAAPFAYLLQ